MAPSPETVEKPLRGFPTGWMQPVARTHRPPAADDSHTYGLRSIFSGAHVTGENDLILFRASERETLRGFFDTLRRGGLMAPSPQHIERTSRRRSMEDPYLGMSHMERKNPPPDGFPS